MFTAESERMAFLRSFGLQPIGMKPHKICRQSLFDDVICLYQTGINDIETQFPFRIKFIGEKAIDAGGVARDMFSGFFEECYLKYFDGGSLLTPVIHPHVDITKLPTIGAIISHSYIVSGFMPVRIAFPCLLAVLFGPATTVPEGILLEVFVDSLTVHEAEIFKTAINMGGETFPSTIQSNLVAILSRYGCRQMPYPNTLKCIIVDASRYEFLMKPAGPLSMMHSGLPKSHTQFWSQQSIKDIHNVYTALTVTSLRVLEMIEDPDCANPNEERVLSYLKQLVANMNKDELRAFVRFVTGASMCVASSIRVTFNALDGFARRPISHCCDCTLELSVTYATYPEFVTEFRSILSDMHNNYNWIMDAF